MRRKLFAVLRLKCCALFLDLQVSAWPAGALGPTHTRAACVVYGTRAPSIQVFV